MATSGSTDFNVTGAQIVTDALELIGVVKEGTTINDQQLDRGLRALNRFIKSETEVHLWKKKEITVFPVVGQRRYLLAGANAVETNDLTETTTDADEALGQTVISVTSTTGFNNSDVIGIVQDDDTIHWSTISSFVADDTVTIGDATTAAATSGNKVYVYTTAASRPLKIYSGRSSLDGNDTPEIQILSRDEYDTLPEKEQSGDVVNAYYDPQIGVGELYLWNVPSDVSRVYKFTCQFPVEDFDAQTDNPDFPQEWIDFLVYGLAMARAPAYGKTVVPEISDRFKYLKEMLEEWDEEDQPLKFVIDES